MIPTVQLHATPQRSQPQRTIVLWIPDWPTLAHLREHEESADPASAAPPAAVALISSHRVVACSAAAREEGVRVGIREREAQLRCPGIGLLPYEAELDARAFRPVLTALGRIVPEIETIRPGLCAVRARGPARYYGGEAAAAVAVLALVAELGLQEARIGIADTRFAAEQAAREGSAHPGVSAPAERVRIVRAGTAAEFLASLPITRVVDGELAELLQRLGIGTLGALAALPESSVRQRFGPAGLDAHRLASARVSDHGDEVRASAAPRELSVQTDFEPPVDGADRLAFACSALAEQFGEGLTDEGLVCTEVRIELTDDIGIRHERCWAHPRRFVAADVVNRVRWQSASIPRDPERGGAGIARVRISPVRTDLVSAHEPRLWSTEPDERVHHHLSRVQSMLGHESVVTAELAGGRLARDRWRCVPWATSAPATHGPNSWSAPWPGHLQEEAPTIVFPTPREVELLDAHGAPVAIDADDLLSAEPLRLRVVRAGEARTVRAWSAPWPIRERWWRGTPERVRLQVLFDDGEAWLLLHQNGRWYAEGRYD